MCLSYATKLIHAIVPVLALAPLAQADITVATVPVGNPGNTADSEVMITDGTTGYGRVAYAFEMGRFEVTAAEYCAFLNAVAASDTYELYDANMWNNDAGCKILRQGTAGHYTYSVTATRKDRPVNNVSWGDAVRFVNWLHNGQPVGRQGLDTTEDGSYFINGATDRITMAEVQREPDATWVLPTEDEWYKAAYHEQIGGADVWYDYPTRTDVEPSNDWVQPDPGNHANYVIFTDVYNYTIGSPYWLTEVGAFTASASAYGTFDQGGNVWEWTESFTTPTIRSTRGGAFDDASFNMLAANRCGCFLPINESDDVGFRVARVAPQVPATSPWMLFGLSVALVTTGLLILNRSQRQSHCPMPIPLACRPPSTPAGRSAGRGASLS